MIHEGDDNKKSVLGDDAYLYQKHEVKDAKARFKDLQGAEKWEYFKDYILVKLLAGVGLCVLAVYLLYSIFKPKPEVLLNIAILDCPYSTEAVTDLTDRFNARLVTDSQKQQVQIDYDYYVTSNGYNSRMKLMTFIASSEIDAMILPKSYFADYADAETLSELSDVLSSATLEKLGDSVVSYAPMVESADGQRTKKEEGQYAILITDSIAAANGYEIPEEYYLVFVVNSKHKPLAETVVDIIKK